MAYVPNNISQQDPRWKNNTLGFSNSKIGPYGCTLTALAILAQGFGKNETPATLNQKLKGLGRGSGFIDDLVVWGGLPVLYPDFSLRKITLCREESKRAPLDEIDAALARGQAVLVELDRSPARGIQNHWVVLYKKEGNDYLMNDPWPYPVDDGPTFLRPRYASGRTLGKIITAVVWYEMAGTAPPLDDGFYVRVLASAGGGLRMRAQPTTASATRSLEPARAYLRVLEDETDARAKIGVFGEWLHVRNLDGTEGYVAAWYVEAVANTGSGSGDDPQDDPNDEPNNDPPVNEPNNDDEPTTPTTVAGLKVYVSKVVGERGLRMRKRPGLGGSLVDTLSQTAELTSLEDDDATRNKIGVDGAWLRIQAGAREGYVAAWLLILDPNEEIPEEEPTEDPGEGQDEEENETPQDEPVITPGLKVYVLHDVGERGLRMRAQPSLGGSLITMLSQGAELTSLESDEVTENKVGVSGQWLNIKIGTRTGYVAAWLVTFDLDATPVEEPTQDPEDEPVNETPVTRALSVTVFPSLGRNGLRMRARPSLGGALIGVLPGGTQLTVLDDAASAKAKVGSYGKWLHVQTESGKKGYVAAWYVKLNTNIVHIPVAEELIVYVTPLARAGLRMRKGPSTGYRVVKTLKPNSTLTVLENEEEAIAKIGATGQWLHVRDEAGVEGYVAAWYVVR